MKCNYDLIIQIPTSGIPRRETPSATLGNGVLIGKISFPFTGRSLGVLGGAGAGREQICQLNCHPRSPKGSGHLSGPCPHLQKTLPEHTCLEKHHDKSRARPNVCICPLHFSPGLKKYESRPGVGRFDFIFPSEIKVQGGGRSARREAERAVVAWPRCH